MKRSKLAEIYDAPLGNQEFAKHAFEDSSRRTARSAGNALLKNEHKIPPHRITELKQILSKFFVSDFERWMIKSAAELPVTVSNDENFVQHGEKVVKVITDSEGLEGLKDFEVSWRQNFLDVMKPKFMPEGWNLYHNHERLEVKLDREKRKEKDSNSQSESPMPIDESEYTIKESVNQSDGSVMDQ